MRQKFFAIGIIALMAVVSLFIFEHVTNAQRPDRNTQPGQQQRGGNRGGMDMLSRFNPVNLVNNSWLDLTFKVKVDDETLIKARPVYQATREKFETKMKAVMASGDIRAGFQEIRTYVATEGPVFQSELKKVLTEEQLAHLNKLTKERQMQQQERGNRARGGEGGQRGGQGGQRGQRPSQ